MLVEKKGAAQANARDSHVQMIRREGLSVDLQGLVKRLLCARVVFAVDQHASEITQGDTNVVVLAGINGAIDVGHAAEVGFGVVQLALLLRDLSQFVQRPGHPGMNFAVDLLLNLESLPQHSRGFIAFACRNQSAA